jgi:iron complex outermembrane recepter protein
MLPYLLSRSNLKRGSQAAWEDDVSSLVACDQTPRRTPGIRVLVSARRLEKRALLKSMSVRVTLTAVACALSFSAHAVADVARQIAIPAGDLRHALLTLSKEYSAELHYHPAQVQAHHTAGVRGTYTAPDAVRILLMGTPFELHTDSSGAMAILPAHTDASSLTPSPDTGPNSAGTAEKNDQGPRLEEIVVTADKRSESVLDVPVSVTVLPAANLQSQGIVNFSQYMTLVPSLADFSGGAEGHAAVILRGLNTGYFQSSNTVGYYIDDVPFSATSPLSYGAFLTLDPDLTDIDHLEVLEGPQGTLYGASTLGGLIKVVTNQPDVRGDAAEIQVSGSTIAGGSTGYGLVGITNVVLIPGELALRLSGFDRDNPGYMTNVELNTTDRGGSRKQGSRISLRWTPIDGLDVRVGVFLQSLFVQGWTYEFVNLETQQPLTGPYTYSLHYDPMFHTTYEVYNVSVDYKVGAIGTLTDSTSYAKYADNEQEDYTLYYGAFYNSFAPVPVPPDAAQPFQHLSPSLGKFTEELRFTSQRLGRFEFLAGLFYTNEQLLYTQAFINAIPPSLQPIPGPDGNIVSIDAPARYKEEAGFADLSYYLTDTVDLTLGGRYSQNKQELNYCQTGFAAVSGCVPNASSDTDFTYLAALRWRPRADLNTYVRVASSYRPGGPQPYDVPGYPNSFKPDSLVNYEVGVKGDWLSHRLRMNLAVYDMDWKDIQIAEDVAGYVITSNGGKATVKGAELEIEAVPTENIMLGANLAYTDAKLDSVSSAVTAATGAVAGDTLPFTPTWGASARADYTLPLEGTLTAKLGLTFRYQGAKWSDYPGDPLNTGVEVPHYQTVDVRASLHWDRYQLQARVTNVFGSRGIDSVVDQRIEDNPPAFAAIIPPRMFAMTFVAKF